MTDGRVRVAVDIGGTFTDVVLQRMDGTFASGKFLTTHQAPEEAVLTGVSAIAAEAGVAPGEISLVLHGTTLATNALIERQGARTALITTEGFRDSLEIAFEHRFEVYDLYMVRPEPLVPRELRFGLRERVAADGSVLLELDEADLRRIAADLREADVEAIAVCLLHSYANGAHERHVRDVLAEMLPDVPVTLSCELCPEIREYERASTTCANAYVQPQIAGYLARLETRLADIGIAAPVMMMTSNGGLATVALARSQPVKLVESGPAGGAILAAHVARQNGFGQAMAFDMGGTTAKLVLLDDGQPQYGRTLEVDRVYRFLRGSGLPLRMPVIDLVEIGAGGGSICGVDMAGRISVGPRSAGSEPGPACYGRGGIHATVTDADLILGKLDPANFAGGKFDLLPDLSRAALLADIGEGLGIDDPAIAAVGIAEVVDENMANAARVHASDNGKEIGGRTLIAFGGAAPLHAARIAQKLGASRVVIPVGAGVGSAHGFLLAPVSYEAVRTRLVQLDQIDRAGIEEIFSELRRESEVVVRTGAPGGDLVERRSAWIRYRGQGHEIAVDIPPEGGDPLAIRKAFEAKYAEQFRRIIPGLEVEILTWTLTLSSHSPEAAGQPGSDPSGDLPPPPAVAQRDLWDAAAGEFQSAGIYRREDMAGAGPLVGPAMIVEAETSTLVPAGFTAWLNRFGQIVLERAE